MHEWNLDSTSTSTGKKTFEKFSRRPFLSNFESSNKNLKKEDRKYYLGLKNTRISKSRLSKKYKEKISSNKNTTDSAL